MAGGFTFTTSSILSLAGRAFAAGAVGIVLLTAIFAGPAGVAVVPPATLFMALFGLRPAWGLAFFVVVRSVADAFGEHTLVVKGLSLNPASLLGVAMLVAGAASFARSAARRSLAALLPFSFLVAVTLISGGVAWARFGAEFLPEVFREAARLAVIPAFFMAVYARRKERDRQLLVRAFFTAVFVCGLWGVIQFALGAGVWEGTSGVRRASGPFAYPNTLGYVLLLGINVLLCRLLLGGAAREGNKVRAIGLFVLLVMLALTASITVFVLLILSVLLILVLTRRTLVLAVVLVLIAAASPLLIPRIGMLLRSDPYGDLRAGQAQNTLTARLHIWHRLLGTFCEHPVVGWGLRTTRRVNPVIEFERGIGSDPHNDCILFMVEGGVVGLAGFLAFHVCALLLLARRGDRLPPGPERAQAAALWITYVAMMVGSLGNNLLSFTAYVVLFWGWVGVAWSSQDQQPERTLASDSGG